MKERNVYTYEPDGDFLFTLGYVQCKKASPPLQLHSHGNRTEFVIPEKGRQLYWVQGKNYAVQPGQVFCANPGEIHGSGNMPEEKGSFYYLIVDLQRAAETVFPVCAGERKQMEDLIAHPSPKVHRAAEELLDSLKKLHSLLEQKASFFHTKIQSRLSEIMILLFQADCRGSISEREMEKSLAYIQRHIREEIAVHDLAQEEGMSLSYFKQRFTACTGSPPGEYVMREKVEFAKKELLRASVTETAYSCGFSSSQYFAMVFRRFCCMTPSQFQREQRKLNNEIEMYSRI